MWAIPKKLSTKANIIPMKTIFYISAFLMLTIRVIVNGQTSSNPVYKISEPSKSSGNLLKQQPDSTDTIYTTAYLTALLKQAEYFDSLAEKLWEEAKNRQALIKELVMEKKLDLHEKSLVKQIEASVLSAKMAYAKFYQNLSNIDSLINKMTGNGSVIDQTQNLNSQAERYLKRAKEMREEANAQSTNEAKLGTMLNAEEQEYLALSKQNESIDLLKSAGQNITKGKQALK